MSIRSIKYAMGILLVLAGFAASCSPARPSSYTVENAAYRLTIDAASGGLRARPTPPATKTRGRFSN